MIHRKMLCKKCGGKAFSFLWKYRKEDEMTLFLCHDGFGFQLSDAIISCASCGEESPYEEEDFLTTEIIGGIL